MPKVGSETPAKIRPFQYHGIDLDDQGDQWLGDCPFCTKESKFSVNAEEGLYRCFVCGKAGNIYSFMRQFHEQAFEAQDPAEYDELAEDRGLLDPETLAAFGVCKSPLRGDWMVPGYSHENKLTNLYRYRLDKASGKHRLMGTPTLSQALVGVPLGKRDASTIYVTEGQWDAMVLWETLRSAKRADDGTLTRTGSEENSLLAAANVYGVPGCTTFHEHWCELFSGKLVVLLFDSDHPKCHPQTGKDMPPAGMEGAKRVFSILASAAEPPEKVEWLKWSKDGFDANRPSGFDVRDLLNS